MGEASIDISPSARAIASLLERISLSSKSGDHQKDITHSQLLALFHHKWETIQRRKMKWKYSTSYEKCKVVIDNYTIHHLGLTKRRWMKPIDARRRNPSCYLHTTEDPLNSLPTFNRHSFIEIKTVQCLKVTPLNLLQSGMFLCEG